MTVTVLQSCGMELEPILYLARLEAHLTSEPIANRTFENLDAVEEELFQRCCQILERPDFIRGLTNLKFPLSKKR